MTEARAVSNYAEDLAGQKLDEHEPDTRQMAAKGSESIEYLRRTMETETVSNHGWQKPRQRAILMGTRRGRD